jgi:hypothetical protein
MKKNCRDKVLQNVEDNFAAFKAAELAKPKTEIFDDAYKINFMENVTDFFEYDDSFDDTDYAFLARQGNRILDRLYDHYMKDWDSTAANDEQISDLVRNYCAVYSERGAEM